MRVPDYLSLIRTSWVFLLVSTLGFGGLALAYVSAQQPMYTSTATITVSACVLVRDSPECDPIRGTPYAIQRAGIYAKVADSDPVLEQAFPDLNLDDRVAFKKAISATARSGAPVVAISVQWTDRKQAIELANQVSTALVEYSAASIDDLRPDSVSIHREGAVRATLAPNTRLTTVVLGLVLGLSLGFGTILARYFLDRRLRSASEAQYLSGVDVLADISHLPTAPNPVGPPAGIGQDDEFRRLRAGLLFRTKESPSGTVLVTSTLAGERAPEVAAGLATSIAASGLKVLLVETNFRDPSIASILQLNADHDFAKFLQGDLSESDPTQHFGSLHVIPATGGAVTLIAASRQLPAFLVEQASKFDLVIVSASPLHPYADTLSLLPVVDSVLMVARIGFVPRRDLRTSLSTLGMLGRTPIGLVMTRTKQRPSA